MLNLKPSYDEVAPYLAQLDWTLTSEKCFGVWFCTTDFYEDAGDCDNCPFLGGYKFNCKFSPDNPHLPHLLTQIRHLHPELFI